MARGKKALAGVSLFPFLSVMVCIIGALSMIIIMSVLDISPASDASGAGLSGPDPVAKKIEEQKKRKAEEELREAALAREVEILEAQMKGSQKELDELMKLLGDVAKQDGARADLAGRAQREGAERAGLDEVLKAALEDIAEEARKLEGAKKAAAASRPGPVKLRPRPFAGGANLNPILIECRGDGIVILQNGAKIAQAKIEDSPELKALFAKIKRAGNWCVLILVRQNGIKSFNSLFGEVRKADVRFGFHPLLSDREVDASGFPKPGWI